MIPPNDPDGDHDDVDGVDDDDDDVHVDDDDDEDGLSRLARHKCK